MVTVSPRLGFTRYGQPTIDPRRGAELEAFRDLGRVVYIVRVGDLIKIGTTSNLRTRLRALRASRVDLMVVIPGDMPEERALHQRFAHALDHGREWFRPTPDLIDYINEARAAVGIPLVESW